jgi:hypothetical protein
MTNTLPRLLAVIATLALAAPAFADCPVVNRADYPASIFTGPREQRVETIVAPGGSMNVPDDEFTVVMGQGATGTTCTSGQRFSIVQDHSVYWSVMPKILLDGATTTSSS